MKNQLVNRSNLNETMTSKREEMKGVSSLQEICKKSALNYYLTVSRILDFVQYFESVSVSTVI